MIYFSIFFKLLLSKKKQEHYGELNPKCLEQKVQPNKSSEVGFRHFTLPLRALSLSCFCVMVLNQKQVHHPSLC